MSRNTGTQIRFLTLAVMVAMFFLAVTGRASHAEEEILEYYTLSAKEVVEYSESVSEGRKAIFIYASWCPYCRLAFTELIDIEKEHPKSIIAVSVDENTDDLFRYVSRYKEIPFSLIILEGESLVETELGIDPRRGIPHYILLDENNKVIKSENMNTDEVRKFIEGEDE